VVDKVKGEKKEDVSILTHPPILQAGHTLTDIPQPCSLLPAYSAHLLTRMVAEHPINLTV